MVLTISGMPPTAETTTGHSAAIASITTLPNGSDCVGNAKTLNVRIQAGTSLRYPMNRTWSDSPSRATNSRHSRSYSGSPGGAHPTMTSSASGEIRRISGMRLDQYLCAFTRHELADKPDDRSVTGAELVAAIERRVV